MLLGLAYLLRLLMERKGQRLAIVLLLVWPVLVFIALMQWTSTTPASQGRLMYGAISSLCLCMAAAFAWLPVNIRKWAIGSIVAAMAIISAVQPFATIMPAYQIQTAIKTDEALAEFQADGAIELLALRLPDTPIAAGDYVEFEADFAIAEATNHDWSIFVHLVSPEGIILAQRAVYPARGLLTTWRHLCERLWSDCQQCDHAARDSRSTVSKGGRSYPMHGYLLPTVALATLKRPRAARPRPASAVRSGAR